jgi:hypothetical protein
MPFELQDQEDASDWVESGRSRGRSADGSAVLADSNFSPDPDIPEGPLPRPSERDSFVGQPRASVSTI